MPDKPLREQTREMFTAAFGEPEKMPTVDGILFRWIVKCEGRTVRITLDSPEFPELAHFLISDTRAVVRLAAETCRSREDVEQLLDQIKIACRG